MGMTSRSDQQIGATREMQRNVGQGRWTRAAVLRVPAAGAAVAALAACGSPGTAASGVSREPVRLQMFNQSGSQKDVEDWQKMMAPFTQKHANVSFEISGPPSGTQMVDKALAMGAAGTPPHLSYSVTRNGPTLFSAGLTQDMSTLVKRDRIDLKDVPKPIVENMDWRGAMLALPYDPGYAFVMYNKSLFERAGTLDPGRLWADKKWDWNAFTQAGVALSRTPAGEQQTRYGYYVQTWEGDYVSFLRTLGGDLLNKDRTKLALDEGPSTAALASWAELVTRHKASPVAGQGPSNNFNSGQVAMYTSHPGNITNVQKFIRDNQAQWTWDVVPHPAPTGKKPVPVLFTNGLYLWKGIKDEATASEALKFLMADESMLLYGKLTGRDPARSTLMPSHVKNLGIPEQDPKTWLKVYQELTNEVRGLPWTVAYVEWHTIVQREILLPVLRGEKSVQEAVSAAAPQVNTILQRK
jgi:multiple sugar transport system substrate-binding protein